MENVTFEYQELKKLSENKNPYATECPNRHLWEEGFRSGYDYCLSSAVNPLQSETGSREGLISMVQFVLKHHFHNIGNAEKVVDEYLKQGK
jgi:hypothetical protein